MPIYLFADKQHSGEIEISMTVDRLLRSIGGTRTLVGFRYAEFMIERALQNPDEVQLITKRLYPETARHYGVSNCSVEKALRILIRHCWYQMGSEPLEFVAGRKLTQPPTNAEFIDMLAAFLRNRQQKVYLTQ